SQVFAPLQMERTFSAMTSDEAMQRAKELAQGHMMAYGFPIAVREMSGFIAGNGSVISTAEDMAHFLIMQNNNGRFAVSELVSSSSLELMHSTPQTLDSNDAMGWVETRNTTQGEVRILEHNGVFSAFYAVIALSPETNH